MNPWHKMVTAGKVSKYGVISGPYFPVFGLNTEIYCVTRRTRNNSVFGHFSHSRYNIATTDFIEINMAITIRCEYVIDCMG